MSKFFQGAAGLSPKTLSVLTSIVTVVSLSGFASFAALSANAATPADYGLHEGDMISAEAAADDPDVYIINDAGYKRLFLNPVIFSFYGQLTGGFAAVHNVSAAVRDAFPTSGLFTDCEAGSAYNNGNVYALEVTGEDTGVLHWVNISGAAAVAADPNFFQKVFCINDNEFNWYPKGADYTSESQVPNYSRTPGATPTPVSGPISVGLSSDNPASNTIISGQAAADLAHFQFNGSGTVTSVTLNRIGVSSDTSLANVYLYEGATRLTDAATVSQGIINFNNPTGLFTVNGSAIISVKADIASGLSGQTVGVTLTSYSTSSGSMSASLSGNLMNIASAPSDFGTVTLNGTTTPSTNSSLSPQDDYTIWQNNITVGNHNAWLKGLQLRIIGSVYPTDLQNFRLQVDGTTVGTAVAQEDANGYISFDLSGNPLLLQTGTRQIRVLADIISGSSRNFTVSLRQRPDLQVVESQYNQPILVSGTVPASSGQQSIASGTLTVTKTDSSPAGDIVNNASGVPLADFQFQANGEGMEIQSLKLNFTESDGGATAATEVTQLRNVALYVDGVQVGSTQTLQDDSASTTFTTFNFGSGFSVQPGTPRILEVRGDIYDNDGTNNIAAGQTIGVNIVDGTGTQNVEQLTSLGYIDFPTGNISGNTMTIRTGSLSVTKYTGYANQTVVVPRQQFKLGSYNLTEGSSEDVNINTINVDFPQAGVGTFTASKVQNVFLKIWNASGSLIAQTAPKSTISGTASNSFSVNFTIPATQTYTVEVYGDINSGITNGDTMTTNLDAAGLTTASSTSVSVSGPAGQNITANTGSLNLQSSSTPPNRIVNGGQQVTTYSFTLQPTYDDFTLDEVGMNLSSSVASSSNAVGTVYLYDGSTLIGSEPMASGASISLFSGLNDAIPQAGGTKTFNVQVKLNNVGVGANDTNGLVQIRLSHIKYHGSNGVPTTSTLNPSSFAGNANYVVASYPTFTNVGLPSSVLSPGQQTLFKTQVSATGGAGVQWKKIVFTTSVTAHPTITAFKVFENGVDISSFGAVATASKIFSTAGVGTGTITFTLNNGNERTIPAGSSVTLELRGTVGGSNVAGDSISTQIANPSGSSSTNVSDDYTTVAGRAAGPSFIWSDQSSPGHSTSTDDWFDDALLLNLVQTQAIYQ